MVDACISRSSHRGAIKGRVPPDVRLFVKLSVIVEPKAAHPFVEADMVVYRVPMYQKSNPIGMALKFPSSVLPAVREGEVAPLMAVNVPVEPAKV